MKLTKIKIARLTDDQSKSIKGGIAEAPSTKHKFTCGWCTSDDTTFNESCETKNEGVNTCKDCPAN